ncbi:MAG: hypothetical protein GX181_00405 [Synergistaceae bacterium]|nr:hypothetical protein [Synergistota bacterium]NLM70404.1 hypothetical protein [Synergistaceae bacterium]
MATEDIRTFLARLFLGKAKVRSLRTEERKVDIQTVARQLEVRPLRKPERAFGSKLLGAGMRIEAKGFRLPHGAFDSMTRQVKSVPVTLNREVKVGGRKILGFEKAAIRRVKRLSVKNRRGLKRVASLPFEVGNRLQWYDGRGRLSSAGESPLALYYPVFEDGMIKSIFNKDKGTLIVWYNPQKAHRVGALLLVRNFSAGGRLEWRQVDV